MAIDVEEVFGKMMSAGADAFGPGWAEARAFAKVELRTLAQRMDDIGEGLEHGDFDLPTAKMLLTMQINLAIATIAGATTLVSLAVEAALTAILDVVKDVVNGTLGVPLI